MTRTRHLSSTTRTRQNTYNYLKTRLYTLHPPPTTNETRYKQLAIISIENNYSGVHDTQGIYNRLPRRPPFLRVLSLGIGVTSSARLMITLAAQYYQPLTNSSYLHARSC